MEQILVESLTFNDTTQRMHASWYTEGQSFIIEGTFFKNEKHRATKSQKVQFTLQDGSGDIKSFSGNMDVNRSKIKGTWKDMKSQNQTKYFFEFILALNVKGTLHMKLSDSGGIKEINEEIEVNFKKKEIRQAEGMGGNIEEFYAIEAVDQAELCYFVL